MNNDLVNTLINSFSKSIVLVVGDVMIDSYLIGNVNRISPEAPVPILDVKNREYRLGGAANVALNLKKLGAEPILCSVIGNDEKSFIFMDLMAKSGLNTTGIVKSETRKTTIKYRIIGNRNQMLRIDDEMINELSIEDNESLLERISITMRKVKADALVFEDYDKGVLSYSNIQKIIQLAKNENLIISTDPKKRNFESYSGVTLFKPNLKEFCNALSINRENISFKTLEENAQTFVNKYDIKYLMTTLSEKGISVYDKANANFYHYPANELEVCDVSGAGDTVISVATLSLVAGLDIEQVALLSNLAGGVVCQYQGVVALDAELLKNAILKQNLHLQ